MTTFGTLEVATTLGFVEVGIGVDSGVLSGTVLLVRSIALVILVRDQSEASFMRGWVLSPFGFAQSNKAACA